MKGELCKLCNKIERDYINTAWWTKDYCYICQEKEMRNEWGHKKDQLKKMDMLDEQLIVTLIAAKQLGKMIRELK